MARASNLWHGIRKVWPIMSLGMRMSIKDGRDTSFWTDRWVDLGEMLIDHALDASSPPNPTLPVAQFTTPDGEWNIPHLRSHQLEELVLQVMGVQTPKEGYDADIPIWGSERDERFRVKSAYQLLTEGEEAHNTFDWRSIWRWRGPARITHFLWLAARERLLTNGERNRRHLSTTNICPQCKAAPETILDVLRDCEFSRLPWMQFIQPSGHQRFFRSHLQDWIIHHVRQEKTSLDFGIFCWSLWQIRNDRVFAGKITTTAAFI
ncbi:unnamed protein product [Linum trigynum]|uniref:Reverse transcriptase zinc-binding domain-containing protein n=1 Tax=Linum trigynum TaxID=586398 RepID=A0AAV2GC43_9ROSI